MMEIWATWRAWVPIGEIEVDYVQGLTLSGGILASIGADREATILRDSAGPEHLALLAAEEGRTTPLHILQGEGFGITDRGFGITDRGWSSH